MRSPGLIGGLAGLTGALLFLASAGGAPVAPVLIGLAPFPFFVATLGWGNASGLLAGAVALVIACAALIPAVGAALALANALAFALIIIAPAFWLSHLALLHRQMEQGDPASPVEWYPLGRLLLWLAGMASAGYLALELLTYGSRGQSLAAAISAYLDSGFPAEMRAELMDRVKVPDWATLRDLMARVLPAMGGVFWQIWIAANGIGAYSLLAATGRCPRPEAGWRHLALARGYAVPFLACLALSMVSHGLTAVAGTLAALLFIPYFFLGLAVVHAIPLQGPGRVALLGLFYFLLLLQAWLALLVGIVGLVEQWSGLRARLARGPGREDK